LNRLPIGQINALFDGKPSLSISSNPKAIKFPAYKHGVVHFSLCSTPSFFSNAVPGKSGFMRFGIGLVLLNVFAVFGHDLIDLHICQAKSFSIFSSHVLNLHSTMLFSWSLHVLSRRLRPRAAKWL
jgi:hypothetical protein